MSICPAEITASFGILRVCSPELFWPCAAQGANRTVFVATVPGLETAELLRVDITKKAAPWSPGSQISHSLTACAFSTTIAGAARELHLNPVRPQQVSILASMPT